MLSPLGAKGSPFVPRSTEMIVTGAGFGMPQRTCNGGSFLNWKVSPTSRFVTTIKEAASIDSRTSDLIGYCSLLESRALSSRAER
jgi:hypothetical protein